MEHFVEIGIIMIIDLETAYNFPTILVTFTPTFGFMF